jgi:hypothetical protein
MAQDRLPSILFNKKCRGIKLAQINVERGSNYLTSSEEYLLKRIKSKNVKDFLINIYVFEHMKFNWNKYKNEIKTYKAGGVNESMS